MANIVKHTNSIPMEEPELVVDEVQEETEALVTYEIATYPSDLTLWGIRDMWMQGDIEIPEFQRNYVWTMSQASLLIESFLLGLPVPQVFFYIDDENKNLVIDGQQRIMSSVYFFDGLFGDESSQGKRQVFRLTGLDPRSPFVNKQYSDLDESSQRRLRNSVLRAINIKQLSPKQENTSIYHIFERLNTGGTPLKPQEIRNCVFRGGFAGQLRSLNRDKNWRKILGMTGFDKHQKDVELVLRLFALSGNQWEKYVKPMKEFLNKAMSENKAGNSERVTRFCANFEAACAIALKEFGPKAFHIRGPLNSSALDSVMCTLIDNLPNVPEDLPDRFGLLVADPAFKSATFYGTSDADVLKARFKKARHILIDA